MPGQGDALGHTVIDEGLNVVWHTRGAYVPLLMYDNPVDTTDVYALWCGVLEVYTITQ